MALCVPRERHGALLRGGEPRSGAPRAAGRVPEGRWMAGIVHGPQQADGRNRLEDARRVVRDARRRREGSHEAQAHANLPRRVQGGRRAGRGRPVRGRGRMQVEGEPRVLLEGGEPAGAAGKRERRPVQAAGRRTRRRDRSLELRDREARNDPAGRAVLRVGRDDIREEVRRAAPGREAAKRAGDGAAGQRGRRRDGAPRATQERGLHDGRDKRNGPGKAGIRRRVGNDTDAARHAHGHREPQPGVEGGAGRRRGEREERADGRRTLEPDDHNVRADRRMVQARMPQDEVPARARRDGGRRGGSRFYARHGGRRRRGHGKECHAQRRGRVRRGDAHARGAERAAGRGRDAQVRGRSDGDDGQQGTAGRGKRGGTGHRREREEREDRRRTRRPDDRTGERRARRPHGRGVRAKRARPRAQPDGGNGHGKPVGGSGAGARTGQHAPRAQDGARRMGGDGRDAHGQAGGGGGDGRIDRANGGGEVAAEPAVDRPGPGRSERGNRRERPAERIRPGGRHGAHDDIRAADGDGHGSGLRYDRDDRGGPEHAQFERLGERRREPDGRRERDAE